MKNYKQRLEEIENSIRERDFRLHSIDVEYLFFRVKKLTAALVDIENHIDKTNFHDCCVTKTCQPIYEDGKKVAYCTFQYGVNRGFGELGHIARAALESES